MNQNITTSVLYPVVSSSSQVIQSFMHIINRTLELKLSVVLMKVALVFSIGSVIYKNTYVHIPVRSFTDAHIQHVKRTFLHKTHLRITLEDIPVKNRIDVDILDVPKDFPGEQLFICMKNKKIRPKYC